MKKILIVFSVIIRSVSFAIAQEAQKDTAVLTFEKPIFDLGTVTPGSHVFEFKFTNTGKGILQITNVAPTCGCTNVTWTKEPVKPGESGVVKTTFTGYTVGTFSKSITVNSISKTPVSSISFKGVIADPAKETTAAVAKPEQK